MIPGNYGRAVLAAALRDLSAGVSEDIARNDGHRIREYAKRLSLTPPINWCAAAVSTWLCEAADSLNIIVPVHLSAAARGLEASCVAAGIWMPWYKLAPEHITPGSIIVWWRVSRKDWQGHVGIVESLDPNEPIIHTIEGNSGPKGDRVARMRRDLIDERLLGIGCFQLDVQREPTSTELLQAEPWKDLSHEVMIEGEPRDPLAEFDERHGK